MKLTEAEGKELFRTYAIKTPSFELITREKKVFALPYPLVLKSQVRASDRKKKGGILIVESQEAFTKAVQELFAREIDGQFPAVLLAEEYITAKEALYVSFSYSTDHQGPVLSLNTVGGSGVREAIIAPLDILAGLNSKLVEAALKKASITQNAGLTQTILNLWRLFIQEKLLLAEINPLFVLEDGGVVAGDAKVVRDDATLPSEEKPIVSLGGDIAILASGGGASMLNIDILMQAGGKPLNYVEYSGNPPSSVVEELTKRVLSTPGIRGVWVIGGTANFTDTYETLSGFVAGLRSLIPKPSYPIVIRRDGPRLAEAREMLVHVAKKEGYRLYVFGGEMSMARSADFLLQEIKKS